jgi:phosphotransferase system enzyme I (PtsI)
VTRDGERVAIRANLELPEEIPALERYHAEGIGLFRSEFLYLRALPRRLRDAARGRVSASRGHPNLRPRRREGDRTGGSRREPGARAPRPALLPRPPRSLRRAAPGALPRLAARRA